VCDEIYYDRFRTLRLQRDQRPEAHPLEYIQPPISPMPIISRQVDYLGKMPVLTPKPVRVSENPREMLRFDLDNENETIRNYRQRVRQCEALGEFAMAEQIREILVEEQDHQIDLGARGRRTRRGH
jgi:Ferritin-like domain